MLFSDIFRVNKLIYQRVSNWTPPWSSGRGSTWPAGAGDLLPGSQWWFHGSFIGLWLLLYCYTAIVTWWTTYTWYHLITDVFCVTHLFLVFMPGIRVLTHMYIYIYIDPSSSISFIVKLKFCNGTYSARRMTIACCKALPQKPISPCEAKSQDISIHLGLFRSIMAKW